MWVDSDSDTIFSASICLNTALLLREIGDFRSSLTLLKKVRKNIINFILDYFLSSIVAHQIEFCV